MTRRSKSRRGADRKPPPHPPFRPLAGVHPPPTGAVARPVHRTATADKIAEVLAARHRVADAYHMTMAEALAPLPDQSPTRHMEGVRPGDIDHLKWVIANQAERRHDFIGEEPYLQRLYRRDYARFGGSRPYFKPIERGQWEMEYIKHMMPRVMRMTGMDFDDLPPVIRVPLEAALAGASEEEGERISDLLLKEVWLVSDILPFDPPPKPASWAAPAAGTYAPPAAALLERGPDLDTDWAARASRDPAWALADNRDGLARMATDPGLLRGWPADNASWSPYHAMTLLGALGDHRTAPLLLDAIDFVKDDDWITDHLFESCLALMGPPVEPALWVVAHDRHRDPEVRGLALLALAGIADRHPSSRDVIAHAIADFMQQRPLLDRKRKTVNAYGAFLLNRAPFDGSWTKAVIRKADAARLLDHKIFNPAEMEGF